jgi:Holliday junction resolvasome RuvABC endonuclease subunit
MNTKTVILGIDLSFRKCGICVLRRTRKFLGPEMVDAGIEINPMHEECIKTKPPLESDKKTMIIDEIENIKSLRKRIEDLWCFYHPDVMVIEVPYFSQSAKGSYAMGVCHSIVEFIRDNFWYKTVIILPKELKDWAGSKRGDGKKEVAAKVKDYNCYHHIKNDDILDAIGICLMHCDKLSLEEYYEQNKRKKKAEN